MGERQEKSSGENPLVIPFSRAVRVRNFKLWRSRHTLASGKEKTDIDCVNVSSLDGSWMVRIPSTMGVYAMIVQGYATVDENLRDNFLGMVFTNYYNLTTINSEALHDAFFFLAEMMSYPYLLLSEKDMEKRMRASLKDAGMAKDSIKEHVSQMVEYRRQLYALVERKRDNLVDAYERQQEDLRRSAAEEDAMMGYDALADDAIGIIKEGDDSE